MTKKIITITKYHFADYYAHRFTVGLGVYSLYTHTQTHTHTRQCSWYSPDCPISWHSDQEERNSIPSQFDWKASHLCAPCPCPDRGSMCGGWCPGCPTMYKGYVPVVPTMYRGWSAGPVAEEEGKVTQKSQ